MLVLKKISSLLFVWFLLLKLRELKAIKWYDAIENVSTMYMFCDIGRVTLNNEACVYFGPELSWAKQKTEQCADLRRETNRRLTATRRAVLCQVGSNAYIHTLTTHIYVYLKCTQTRFKPRVCMCVCEKPILFTCIINLKDIPRKYYMSGASVELTSSHFITFMLLISKMIFNIFITNYRSMNEFNVNHTSFQTNFRYLLRW